ncbi:glutamine-hydrolyzing GMP synthase [Candidatus Bathyarchaeota archaeon]|nr:glutamine-hydrolyzing GMP synthase [Candidatus Bathyarchaeota archaeon]
MPDLKPHSLEAEDKVDTIVILDFGGQYCHLISRRIREMNVYTEIMPYDVSLNEIIQLEQRVNVRGIILSGSPSSVRKEDAYMLNKDILASGFPILGLCYGHQLVAEIYGGDVRRSEKREYGLTTMFVDKPVGILRGLGAVEKVWMSHGDTVFSIPHDFELLAHTETSPVAAFRHKTKPIYGLQCHPEVTHTENGRIMLRNFVFDICKCKNNWHPGDILEKSVKDISNIVGNSKAIIALSGGVDSSVTAALAAKALGDNLIMVHVDHGFMRLNETENLKKVFKKLGAKIIVVEAQERFLNRIKGVRDPEEKRKIIGEEFIRVFEDEALKTEAEYLIQGTIYPDRIESGFKRHSDKIKTHHNVGGLPSKMRFKGILEPLRDLYKDEVRTLGVKLGLPDSIINRQPFPGPGLAVRIVGEVTEEKIKALRKIDAIVCEEVESMKIGDKLWQYFAVLTDTKSTGVKGDERAYGWVAALRFVESLDGMTASFHKPSWEILERISSRITNEVPEVTRVVYDITHKPPSTIEWE